VLCNKTERNVIKLRCSKSESYDTKNILLVGVRDAA